MGYHIYILYSRKFNRTYTGQTEDLNNRLSYHNSGKVRSTKAYIPWERIYSESFDSRSESMQKEKWFKSSEGRKLIKKILKDFLTKKVSG